MNQTDIAPPMLDRSTPPACELPTTPPSIRVRPEVATDWLLRTCLPEFLRHCDHDRVADALADLPPLGSPFDIRDRYATSRTATSLRAVRAELIDEIRAERRWAAKLGATNDAFGGAAAMRATLFPHIDEITGYVRSVAVTHDLGDLLHACVRLAIELIVTRHDNDHAGHRDASLEPVESAYRSLLAELVARGTRSPLTQIGRTAAMA
ncbi:MAG: hypothetical protein ACRCSL_04510 [Microbacterium sp.]